LQDIAFIHRAGAVRTWETSWQPSLIMAGNSDTLFTHQTDVKRLSAGPMKVKPAAFNLLGKVAFPPPGSP